MEWHFWLFIRIHVTEESISARTVSKVILTSLLFISFWKKGFYINLFLTVTSDMTWKRHDILNEYFRNYNDGIKLIKYLFGIDDIRRQCRKHLRIIIDYNFSSTIMKFILELYDLKYFIKKIIVKYFIIAVKIELMNKYASFLTKLLYSRLSSE